MAVYKDRIRETSTSVGLGDLDLDGPFPGYRGFVESGCAGQTVPYLIEKGTEWEQGWGKIIDAAPDRLQRDAVINSSNADAKVDWGAGVKQIRLSPPAGTYADVVGANTWSVTQTFSSVRFGGTAEIQGNAVHTPAAFTSDQHDYSALGSRLIGRLSSDAPRNLTGIVNNAGRILILENVGSFNITLVHESPSSSSFNRFAFGGTNVILSPDQAIILWYDNTSARWRSITLLRSWANLIGTPTTLFGYGITDAAGLSDANTFTNLNTFKEVTDFEKKIRSFAALGTAPLEITSTTVCANLNADMVDGLHASAFQTADATLTALAAYNTNGIVCQTAADTFAGRAIAGTANQVNVSNGDGVAGNPTLSLPQDIAATSNVQFAGLLLGSSGALAAKLHTRATSGGAGSGIRVENTSSAGYASFDYINDQGGTGFQTGLYGSTVSGGLANYAFFYHSLAGGSITFWTRPSGGGGTVRNFEIDGNGNLLGGNATAGTSMTKGIALANGVAPTSYAFAQMRASSGEWVVYDTSGNATTISPHPKDAPDELRDEEPGVENITRSVNYFDGLVEWHNHTRHGRQHMLPVEQHTPVWKREAFDEYNARRGLAPGDPDYLMPVDWDEHEDWLESQRNQEIAEWQVRRDEYAVRESALPNENAARRKAWKDRRTSHAAEQERQRIERESEIEQARIDRDQWRLSEAARQEQARNNLDAYLTAKERWERVFGEPFDVEPPHVPTRRPWPGVIPKPHQPEPFTEPEPEDETIEPFTEPEPEPYVRRLKPELKGTTS